jgi:digeranylgeranylglycerophospholipid reductase
MRVAIVGAGINGCYLAYKLSDGHQVTVFERKSNLGSKPCSGLISERVWNHIYKPEVGQYDQLVGHIITEARIHFPKKIVDLKFKSKMLVFDRQKLDEYVGRLAEQNGVNFLFNTDVKSIATHGDKPIVNGIGFDKLIGCDGVNSIVRKKLGCGNPKVRLGIYCYTKENCKDQWVDTWPLKDGFSWKIPRGDNVEWGVVAPVDVAKKEFADLAKREGLKYDKIYSHAIPEGLCFPTIHSKAARDITICGDSAGLTKPWSGGGVIWGMIAGDLLVKNLKDFRKYERAVKKQFNNRITLNLIGRNIISNPFVNYFIPRKIEFDGDGGIIF